MPSEKRARQRAASAQKRAVVNRKQKRRKTARRMLTFGSIVVAVIVIVVLLQLAPKKKHHPAAAGKSTTTSSLAATTTTTTFPVPTTEPLSATAAASTCPPAAGSKTRETWFKAAPPDCIAKTAVYDATFVTSLGKFVVEMHAAASYAAVNNFVFLARWRYYDGTFFHRIIPGFVVQGGDPTGLGTGGPNHLPGYSFTGNTPPASCKTAPSSVCYQPGDLAMANTGTSATNGSQFFFVLPGGQKTLDKEPLYTDFGHVTSGLGVVEKIGADGIPTGTSAGTPTVRIYLLKVTVTQVKA
ncbi:MAG: peptidylprolyl isomerase [Acidimicrobiales bacterium]